MSSLAHSLFGFGFLRALGGRTILLALLLALTAACAQSGGGSFPSAAALPPLRSDYPTLPSGLERGQVTRVVDGDTIDVQLSDGEARVRLIGINTPESVDPRRPVECFGQEASVSAAAMLDGQTVLLESDPSQGDRDRFSRLLRYVWLEDGRMVNLEQITQGFAAEYTFDTPYKYRELFRDAQREAREAGRGLWAATTCDGDFSPAADPPATSSDTETDRPSCPDVGDRTQAPETPVRIVGLDKQAEVIELQNVGDAPVDLDGWLVCSQRGNESQGGIIGSLAPGATGAFTNPGEPIWSNSNPDDAALFDPNGALVSYWVDR